MDKSSTVRLSFRKLNDMNAKQFNRLPRHRKTEVYFSHDLNQAINERGQRGPSLLAQSRFYNDWQSAFGNFSIELDGQNAFSSL